MTTRIEIKNFKSVKHVVLKDCKRINLLIGKPNVGKSNILEALSAFSLPYARYTNNKSLQQFIRCENESELFYNGDKTKDIEIHTDSDQFVFQSSKTSFVSRLNGLLNGKSVVELSGLKIKQTGSEMPNKDVRSYFFPTPFQFENTDVNILQPTTGCNLSSILDSLEHTKDEISDILALYGLKLSFDQASQQLKLLKSVSENSIYLVPFNSIADTLQRMMYYKTAIASNENAILTFEEPEAHSYPPYVSKITTDIIYSESNQFFITTHSPYVLNEFLENKKEDLAIYLIDFEDGETSVRGLTDEEIDKVYQFGVDLFFNSEIFLAQ
ncbi:AAA family ATPase [Bacteroides sp.]|uniref:AAA family ATPase n=1 Tax=Bacteroides sp. TaxID=29523 RepID=UPI001B6217E1|nr:AAA family ATPase [Bacteroides sp.]MBP6066033.1 AAA family ATPase [Bacteroides sp.]MBP6068059.1 AAA family ATPase [Bacteroides sp.]MBP6936327.1 AAA family ATPase [Bacteroides sp.]MBP8621635.1 AAA family ATPase [Bacteroides sp.]MBP9586797.1 AAA family ATPase [Bacteroides sp.]